MTQTLIKRLILDMAATMEKNRDYLIELDQAIGDGDHGINMSRGFSALKEQVDDISGLEFGPAAQKAGMVLVMGIGGASGPLYGSLLMAMGKSTARFPITPVEIANCLEAGVAAVKKRGKSDIGAKTMLDVLVPVVEALKNYPTDPIPTIRSTIDSAIVAVTSMRATKGRASFLGERSEGHIDPGAKSSALLIESICSVIEVKK